MAMIECHTEVDILKGMTRRGKISDQQRRYQVVAARAATAGGGRVFRLSGRLRLSKDARGRYMKSPRIGNLLTRPAVDATSVPKSTILSRENRILKTMG